MDLEKDIKEFLEYTNNFDMSIIHLERKRYHSIRVMEISEKIARMLDLNDTQVKLATLIGLLHDIGRFEEYTVYYKYKENKKIDHGDLGVKILNKDNYIRKYIEEDEYDSIIFKAIKNHNKFEIEKGLTEEELLFTKIIRDADKLDIFYECIEMFWIDEIDIRNVEKSIASDDIMNDFRNYSIIKNDMIKNPLDKLIAILAFVFDINYECSYNILLEERYLDKLLGKFNFTNNEIAMKQIEEVKNIANEYIQKNEKE